MGVVVTWKQVMRGGAQKVDPRVPSSHARHGSPSHWWMPPKRRCRPGPSVLFFVSSTLSASSRSCASDFSGRAYGAMTGLYSRLLVSYRPLARPGISSTGRYGGSISLDLESSTESRSRRPPSLPAL